MKPNTIKYLLCLSVIILATNLFAVNDMEKEHYPFDLKYVSKLYSGRLLHSIDTKINDEEKDLTHQVYLSVINKPDSGLLDKLSAMKCEVDIEHTTSPYRNNPYWTFSANILIDSLNSIVALEEIAKIEDAEAKHYPQVNNANKQTFADSVASIGYTGNNVTIGVMDSGLDVAYKNEDLPHDFLALDYSNYPDEIGFDVYNKVTGHGTWITGVALGDGYYSQDNDINGGGQYRAPASGAELVFMKIGNDEDASASDNVMRAAAIDAIEKYEVDVLTLSYGEYGVYHDGSSTLETTMDMLVQDNNVPIFVSAGNTGDSRYHYFSHVEANDTSEFIRVIVGEKNSPIDFNLIYNNAIEVDLELEYYLSNKTPFSPSYQYPRTQSTNGTYSQISEASASIFTQADYFLLRIVNKSDFPSDCHIYKYTHNGIYFNEPNTDYMTLKPANANKVFAVGAYNSRLEWVNSENKTISKAGRLLGDIAPYSASGPRVDGLQKPNAIAPGSYIITLRDRSINTEKNDNWVSGNGSKMGNNYYYVASGTSLATPQVASIAAQIIGRYDSINVDTLYKVLEETAGQDEFTGATPNKNAGYGKINAVAAINHSAFSPKVITLPLSSNKYCGGEELYVSFQTDTSYNEDNIFIVDLYNKNNLADAYTIGYLESDTPDSILCAIPAHVKNFDKYRIRVRTTSPEIIGSNNGADLTISRYPTTNLYGQDTVCPEYIYKYEFAIEPDVFHLWDVENGYMVDSTGNSISVIWYSQFDEGSITIHSESDYTACAIDTVYKIMIKDNPVVYLTGDTVICEDKTYKYITYLHQHESATWAVKNGTISNDFGNKINVVFDQYLNGEIELVVTNDTCETIKKLTVYNLAGEASEIYGNLTPARKRIYSYTLDTIYGVKTRWTVQGGEIIDSSHNYISVKWLDLENSKITVFRYTNTCSVTKDFSIDVQDEHLFQIVGDDAVCSESIMRYSIKPFDTSAVYEFKIISGELLENIGDSLLIVEWGDESLGRVRVKKIIEEINYIDTNTKFISISPRSEATIRQIADKDGFCKNEPPHTLIEGNPKNGEYFGIGVIDGTFYPDQTGDTNSIEIFYTYAEDGICPDTVAATVELYDPPEMPELIDYDSYFIAHGETSLYKWYLNDTTLLEIGNGKYTPSKTGYYSVSCFAYNGCESEKSDSIYKKFVDVVDDEQVSNWSVYPNPTDNTLNIECKHNFPYDITIFDISGKIYRSITQQAGNISIDVSNLTATTYFVKLQYGKSVAIEKVIIE